MLDRTAIRLMILEALNEIAMRDDMFHDEFDSEEDECYMREEDIEEFSGAGAIAGPILPLGMRTPGPRADIVNVTHRSFGGLGRNKRKRKTRKD